VKSATQDLLSSIIEAEDRSPIAFAALLEKVYEKGYTGPVTIHFKHGRPRLVEIGPPIQIPIGGSGSPEGLDKTVAPAAP
jgi:hypothetical protein